MQPRTYVESTVVAHSHDAYTEISDQSRFFMDCHCYCGILHGCAAAKSTHVSHAPPSPTQFHLSNPHTSMPNSGSKTIFRTQKVVFLAQHTGRIQYATRTYIENKHTAFSSPFQKSFFQKHSTDWLALFLRFLFTRSLLLFKTKKDNNIVVTPLNRTNRHCYYFCIPAHFQ